MHETIDRELAQREIIPYSMATDPAGIRHHMFGVSPGRYLPETLCGQLLYERRSLPGWTFAVKKDGHPVSCERCQGVALFVLRRLLERPVRRGAVRTVRFIVCNRCKIKMLADITRDNKCPRCSWPTSRKKSKKGEYADVGMLTPGNVLIDKKPPEGVRTWKPKKIPKRKPKDD